MLALEVVMLFVNEYDYIINVSNNRNTQKIIEKYIIVTQKTFLNYPSDHHLTVLWIVTAFMWHVMAGQTGELTTQIPGKSKTNSQAAPI